MTPNSQLDKDIQIYVSNLAILSCAVDLGYAAMMKSMGNALSTVVEGVDVGKTSLNGDTLRDVLAARIAQKLSCNK